MGLLLFAWGGHRLVTLRLSAADLARLYQAGFCRGSVALLPVSDCAPVQAAVLRRRLLRAETVSRYDPERLRATRPFPIADDGRFWPASATVGPSATMTLTWEGSQGGRLELRPFDASAWGAPLRSQELVRPDWSANSGLVAYYDLGRVWIADVRGHKFQSLVQAPQLEQGGVLRFSADGTALAFYSDSQRRWMAQDLYVLKE